MFVILISELVSLSPSCLSLLAPSLSLESNMSHFNYILLSPSLMHLHLSLGHRSRLPSSHHTCSLPLPRLTGAVLRLSCLLNLRVECFFYFSQNLKGEGLQNKFPQILHQWCLHCSSGGEKKENYFHTLLLSSLYLLIQMILV